MNFGVFAQLHGLLINDPHPSDRIQRCATEDHPKSKNGAYWYDGERGWVQRWDQGGELIWWDDPNRTEPSAEERAEWARRKAQREREQEQLWGRTAVKAKQMRATAVFAEHNYLHRKGVGDVPGLVLPDGELFVPMHDFVTGDLIGCQLIYWVPEAMKFEKKMLYGTRAGGAAMIIGPRRSDEFVLCEGYATGLSISKALQQMRLKATVLVCFNDKNMITIASKMKHGRRYVFADNDKPGPIGPGAAAAIATGLRWCMSPNVGEDANDLHKSSGLTALQSLIMDTRKLKDPIA